MLFFDLARSANNNLTISSNRSTWAGVSGSTVQGSNLLATTYLTTSVERRPKGILGGGPSGSAAWSMSLRASFVKISRLTSRISLRVGTLVMTYTTDGWRAPGSTARLYGPVQSGRACPRKTHWQGA